MWPFIRVNFELSKQENRKIWNYLTENCPVILTELFSSEFTFLGIQFSIAVSNDENVTLAVLSLFLSLSVNANCRFYLLYPFAFFARFIKRDSLDAMARYPQFCVPVSPRE